MTVTGKTRGVPMVRAGVARIATTPLMAAVVALVSGCGGALAGVTTETSISAAGVSEVASATCNPYGGDKLSSCMDVVSDQCATYASVHNAAFYSQQAADCFKGAYAKQSGQPNPCASNDACVSGFNGGTSPTATEAAASASSSQPAPDDAAPNPHGKPAFSIGGKTEHGDTVRLEGHFGPILPPSESDVDQEALAACPESDGRNLVRRLDLTIAITSRLSADVQVVAPTVAVNEEEGAEEIRKLDFIMSGPDGAVCSKGLGNQEADTVDLGTLQPHERRTVVVWIVLLDAITPAEPHPSLRHLQSQEWSITKPTVRVAGVDAITGGSLSATE